MQKKRKWNREKKIEWNAKKRKENGLQEKKNGLQEIRMEYKKNTNNKQGNKKLVLLDLNPTLLYLNTVVSNIERCTLQ